ncbi:MFS transporter [Myroides sp. LJL116]
MLQQSSERRKKLATLLAFFTIPISGFVTDIYLPSFPAMASSLNLSAEDIQITLSCYLLSYGIAQLFIGSILDNIGRYKPRLISLALLVITNILIPQTTDIIWICALRILQGFAVSVLVVAIRAIFLDIYPGKKSVSYLSYFTIIWSCGPILAPFLGGFLEQIFSWHANFYFLAIYAGILLVLELLISGESLEQKKSFDLVTTLQLYKSMLQNKSFISSICILGLAYSVAMAFNISGPFIIGNTFGYNAITIGNCTLLLGVSWMLGGILGKRRMNIDFEKRILQPSVLQITAVSLLIIIGIWQQNLILLISFAFIIHAASSMLFTSFFSTTMLFFPKNAGLAGGLMGGLVYLITSFTSFLLTSVHPIETQNHLAYGYGILILCLFMTIMYRIKLYKQELKN